MTHPTDYFFQPRPESGRGRHTQESGDAGLSSNMKHKFSDDYNQRAFPVADRGSSVIPIPKGEAIFDPAADLKARSVSAEEGIKAPPPLGEAPPRGLTETSPEESVDVLPSLGTEGQPDEVEEDSKMEKPAKSSPLLVPGAGRNHRPRWKRTAGKSRKLYVLCLMAAVCLPVTEGFPVAQIPANQKLKCFTCTDEDRCLKLMNIYDSDDDTHLYQRDLHEMLPECSETSPPLPAAATKSCAVCRAHSEVVIYCSEDVGPRRDVEDSDGGSLHISPECVQQDNSIPGRPRFGLIASVTVVSLLAAALVISKCCQKKSAEGVQQ